MARANRSAVIVHFFVFPEINEAGGDFFTGVSHVMKLALQIDKQIEKVPSVLQHH